jgi:hypothetical protein
MTMKKIKILALFLFLIYVLPGGIIGKSFAQPLNGTYTIGGTNPNYPNLNAAVTDVTTNGVNGPVVFKIRNGTYSELLLISAIPGASNQNTVSFEGESQDSSAVIINGSTVANQQNTLFLNQVEHVRFKHLFFLQAPNVNNNAVIFINRGKYIRFSNCFIQGHNSSTSSATDYLIQGGCDSALSVLNCNLFGAKEGISVSNSFSHRNLLISRNTINSGGYSIRISGGALAEISRNAMGRILIESHSRLTCFSNRISGTLQLISSNGWNTQPARIYNNQIIKNGNDLGATYGFRSSSSSYLDVAFNSISISSTTSGYALFAEGSFSSTTGWIKIRNNNIFRTDNTPNNYIFYIPNAISYIDGIEMSNNNYYSPGPNFTHNYANLGVWQSTTGLDTNSISAPPLPVSATNLASSQTAFDGAAIPLSFVAQDIDGNPRDPQSPDIGAFEQLSPPQVFLGSDTSVCQSLLLNAGNAGSTYLWTTGQTTQQVLVHASGVYGVTVTNAGGQSADSIGVIVNNPTLFELNATDSVVCSGSMVAISNTSGLSLNWGNGGGVSDTLWLNVLVDTTITASFTNAAGCTSSGAISIAANPNPFAGINLSTTLICNSDAPLLLSGGVPSGGIYFVNGSQNVNLNPSGFINEFVEVLYTVTNPDGCSASAVDSIFVDVCTGKNEVGHSKLWLSFSNRIQSLDNLEGFKQYAVYDASGRLLLQAGIPQAGNINLHNLNGGFYLLTLFNQNLRKTFTVIVTEN